MGEITGGMWATLAVQYVKAIVTGNINIESAYDSMIRQENTKSLEAAIEAYQAEMDKLKLPVEVDALYAANRRAHDAATKLFLKSAVNTKDHQGYFDNMNKTL